MVKFEYEAIHTYIYSIRLPIGFDRKRPSKRKNKRKLLFQVSEDIVELCLYTSLGIQLLTHL